MTGSSKANKHGNAQHQCLEWVTQGTKRFAFWNIYINISQEIEFGYQQKTSEILRSAENQCKVHWPIQDPATGKQDNLQTRPTMPLLTLSQVSFVIPKTSHQLSCHKCAGMHSKHNFPDHTFTASLKTSYSLKGAEVSQTFIAFISLIFD